MKVSRVAGALVLVVAGFGPALAQGTTTQPGAAAGMKMTQSECESLWNRADSAKSGNLPQAQAQSYVTNFSSVDTDSNGQLSRTEFMAGCDKGLVQSSASTGAGAGQSGTGAGTGTGGTKK